MTQQPGASSGVESAGQGISRGQWMALAAALLGWMFDGAEQGLFSLVGRPAVADLLGYALKTATPEQEAEIGRWFGIVTGGFLVGAATGGVLFGWLGDRIGRVRAMTLSVLTYAVFTGLCGLAASAWQVGMLRFIASLGIGGEWSLGVALVMEVWPNRSRALMAGLIGAAANVGFLLVGLVGLSLSDKLPQTGQWLQSIGVSPRWAQWLVGNEGWRLMMLLGTTPSVLTFFFRLFVPESRRWQHEQSRGATSYWATRDLLGVLIGASGPVMISVVWAPELKLRLEPKILATAFGLFVAAAGYSYPVIRYLQRQAAADGLSHAVWRGTVGRMLLAAVLGGTALTGTWAAAQWAPTWAHKLSDQASGARELTQNWSAIGAIVGTIAAALMGDWLGRRVTYSLLCLSSMASLVWLYQCQPTFGASFLIAAFLVGLCTASFYGWLPLYLPELFRTNVRATCQGFGFNFGRILAFLGSLQTGNLMKQYSGEVEVAGVTLAGSYAFACSAMSLVYIIGLVLIWFAPETKGKPLPE